MLSGNVEFGPGAAAVMVSYRETRFEGLPISGGVVLSRVCLFNDWRHSRLPQYKVAGEGVARERARLEHAVLVASEHLAKLVGQVTQRVGAAQAAIFIAQKMMLEDEVLHTQMFEQIENSGLNAETVVSTSLDAYEFMLAQVGDDYLRERVTDIAEVRRRLLNVLGNMTPSLQCEDEHHCHRGNNRIIVAEELTPTLTMALDTDHILGFVTEHGGAASHAAILARALGIPAVSGIDGIHNRLSCGIEVLLDGYNGALVVWPKESTLDEYPAVRRPAAAHAEPVGPVPGLSVMANINRHTEVGAAVAMLAEGIGLFRTEFAFFIAGRALTEEEQFEQYAATVHAMNGNPVTFRLLDMGGDKPVDFLNLPRQDNPQLGLRGARLLMARPELLEAQARALARASRYGPIEILYPMIADVEQFVALRDRFKKAAAGIETCSLRHGVMFEIPSACICAREILEEAEFGSVGTNDLTQYLFAVDRDNELVAGDYDTDKPAFWALMSSVVRAAAEARRPLSVCGEIAAYPPHVLRLMDLGVTSVSVSPRLIPDVRRAAASRITSASGEFI